MFAVFLRFAENKAKAGAFMDGHKAWLQTGFSDGSLLAAGSLQDPDGGGPILAHNASRDELQTRINEDVIRYLTIRVDEHESGPSVMMRKNDRERSRRRDREDN